MSLQEQKSLTINELIDRYDISRQGLYKWFDALEIKLEDHGRFKLATPEQVQLMDDLKAHLDGGGYFKDFVPVSTVTPVASTDDSTVTSTIDSTVDTVIPSVDIQTLSVNQSLDRIEGLLQLLIQNLAPPDPLWEQRVLSELATNKWLLPTSKVKALIGTAPRGQAYHHGCWQFTKAGKIGREAAWEVSRI